ncbi:hypothetical protein SAMN04487916_10914 [Arthrobacter sp. ov407]|uniref:hypothetical protein n=1 Tax=Arthrobacter sp. ov407 TaxID=1761748 RepID=UPI000880347C|nr:hypothetical protein [Arthrobacter sp. ov407]SDL43649.1 hypothetical protein SAMN04487916_10914 [Arthrobacter sp. ov407]
MSTAAAASPAAREPDFAGHPVVVLRGSAGVILAGRDSAKLEHAANELLRWDFLIGDERRRLGCCGRPNSRVTVGG